MRDPWTQLSLTGLVTLLAISTLWVGYVGAGFADRPGGSLATVIAPENSTPLTIVSFAANPTTIFIFAQVFLNVSAKGGAPPYSYWYRDLPPGCTTNNVSSLTCYPYDARVWTIEATVNDTAGAQVNATTNLTIKNGFGLPPDITSFVAYPPTVATNHITYLNVSATSQSGDPTSRLSYAYFGLPPGCGTFNQTNLSCIPSEPGTYTVTVRVTDSYTQFSQKSLTLTVTGMGPTTNSTGRAGLTTTDEYIIVGVMAVIVVVAVVFFLAYVRKPPSKGSGFDIKSAIPEPPEESRPPGQ